MTTEAIVAAKAEHAATWTNTVTNIVGQVFKNKPDLTQLQSAHEVYVTLRDHFDSYPGPHSIRVNPKGDKQIQVILTLSELGDKPHIKIKPRYDVPSLVTGVEDGVDQA
ncbi:hypothetical protein ST201phi2-1p435 [Pseudomonas phage 201phi2-1]|uniref:Uncharacterized protein n=1 Tax=Pseudomonas phage 201phi2-1 TaxID=198110 RepID=B3FJU3_BP201|nr:hypothetical protein ST201phi2-1p435 [Pseudomonas phage 201phi2-1]ABY63258.1 hypothetical protein 201phi2-1p435 [Pseudomonas phage 201phi2-1]